MKVKDRDERVEGMGEDEAGGWMKERRGKERGEGEEELVEEEEEDRTDSR